MSKILNFTMVPERDHLYIESTPMLQTQVRSVGRNWTIEEVIRYHFIILNEAPYTA